jgi:hypothetical protein
MSQMGHSRHSRDPGVSGSPQERTSDSKVISRLILGRKCFSDHCGNQRADPARSVPPKGLEICPAPGQRYCPSAGVCDFPWVNRDRDRAGRLQVQPTSAMPLRAASQASFVEFAVAELSLGYFFDAHFDSSATMFPDNPNVENLTTRDGFLIID